MYDAKSKEAYCRTFNFQVEMPQQYVHTCYSSLPGTPVRVTAGRRPIDAQQESWLVA